MKGLLRRKEPVIAYGDEAGAFDTSVNAGAVRLSRTAPTGDLTRSIRREQSKASLDVIRRSLGLSPTTFEAIAAELLSHGGPLLDTATIMAAMRALYDCEPVGAMTSHPIILVGGTCRSRMQTALSLSQKIERAGRSVALYSLAEGKMDEPCASFRGGLNILHVGSAEACVDAVHVKEPAELAIVEASCLDTGAEKTQSLALLTLGINAEVVYVHDEDTPLPHNKFLAGVGRTIISGRPSPERFGMLIDAAYANGWALAGQCTAYGIYHPMSYAMLADRFALSIR